MPPPKGESLLAEAIRTARFDPVYCIIGENEFRKDEAVKQLVASALDPSVRDFNFDTYRGGEADAQALEASLTTLPMMAERRVVIVRDAASVKKAPKAVLERYVANPSRSTVLVLVAARDSELPSTLTDNATLVEINALEGEKLLKWITKYAKTTHGAEVEREAAELLSRVVGGDLLDLAGEIDKLASYNEGKPIDAAAVSAVVGVRPDETIVDLLAAVARRDARAALPLVSAVLRQPKTTGVNIIMALGAQMLGIGFCRAKRDAGVMSASIEPEAAGLARRVSFMMNSWPNSIASNWARASANWALPDVDAAIAAMLAADRALKETRVASEEQIVSTAVLAACAGSALPAAA